MSLPHALTSLTPREAIIDAVSRMFHGFDFNDLELLNSAFLPDDEEVVFEVNNTESFVATGMTEIRTHFFNRVAPMDTTHVFGSERVHIADDAKTAKFLAVGNAQHCPPGRGKEADGPKYLVGGKYSADLELGADGLWKIRKFVADVLWAHGDVSVMAG